MCAGAATLARLWARFFGLSGREIGLAAYSFDFKGFYYADSDFGGNVNAGKVLRETQGKFTKRAYLLVDFYVSLRRVFPTVS